MSSKQVVTVIVFVAVFSWSVVMAMLGQPAAVAALAPALGLLVQQTVQALSGEPGRPGAGPAAAHTDPPAQEDRR
jgi:hypothetical protein